MHSQSDRTCRTVYRLCFGLGLLLFTFLAVPEPGGSAMAEDSPGLPADSAEVEAWMMFAGAWNEYLIYPSTENAAEVYEQIPQWPQNTTVNHTAQRIIDSVYESLPMLKRQVYAGDRNAVRVAFRLMRISDGEFSEWLDIILGSLIRIDARLFLQELKAHRAEVSELSSLVGNLGEEFVDKIAAHNLEMELRIQALSRVDDDALSAIRDECVAALRNDIIQEP